MTEHAATVRRIAIENGLGHRLPPWPGERLAPHPPLEPPGDGQPEDPTT